MPSNPPQDSVPVTGGVLRRCQLEGGDVTLIPEPLDAVYCWPEVPHRLLSSLAAPPLLVLAHGAGADYQHKNMVQLAQALARQGIATLRFNFPFMQAGRRRVDSIPVAVAALQLALSSAQAEHPDSPLLLGGHSFGGRMATHWAAMHMSQPNAAARVAIGALVLCSFPLHTAGKPSTQRTAHFSELDLPMLFVSGDRDALATPSLLEPLVHRQPQAQLHWLATANHGYTILKRSRPTDLGDVFDELASAVLDFVVKLG